MVPQELLIYIQNELQKGISPAQIKIALLDVEWPENLIKMAYAQLGLSYATDSMSTPLPVRSVPVVSKIISNPTVVSEQSSAQSSDSTMRTVITIVALLLSFPIGLLVMWVWSRWKTWVKILVTLPFIAVFLLFVILVIGGGFMAVTHPEGVKIQSNQSTTGSDEKAKNGESCIVGSDCISDTCAHLSTGAVCTDGKNGDACFLSMDCESDHCFNDVCTEGKSGDGCDTSLDCQTGLQCQSKKCL
jgi:hypothetical protein